MFRYRRVRVVTVLVIGWVVLTAVERYAERSPWPSAMLGGLLWSCVVAGVWWFAEWTQSPLRTARASATARASEKADGPKHGPDTETDGLVSRRADSSTPSRR
ncbi:hypothetical protein [Streptomyces sp. HB132]|uniref:hypothetical protein n=1 Tax=Streptomyces sp. HB132 TaxID=767388 RepID=UPI001D7C2920|nr:hypothetical protein [Streptomyces sp. HB132]MBM7442978.1 putative membrane protein YccC [Streptomyces sp. HB132]